MPPFIMFCHVSASKCGRYWLANTADEYDQYLKERDAHHVFCAVSENPSLILPKGKR